MPDSDPPQRPPPLPYRAGPASDRPLDVRTLLLTALAGGVGFGGLFVGSVVGGFELAKVLPAAVILLLPLAVLTVWLVAAILLVRRRPAIGAGLLIGLGLGLLLAGGTCFAWLFASGPPPVNYTATQPADGAP